MRHLLDNYIRAEESKKLSTFDDLTLVELIVKRGGKAVEELPENIRNNHEAVAETIENNIRRLIIDEMAVNPKYYENMSELLNALILQRKQEAVDYKKYLAWLVELTKKVSSPASQSSRSTKLNSAALCALFDNLPEHYGTVETREEKALALDHAIRHKKKADWRGNKFKEREVRNAIKSVLRDDEDTVSTVFEIVKAQSDY